VARAGSGIAWGYFERSEEAARWMKQAVEKGWKAIIEFAPERQKQTLELWPLPGGDLAVMQRIKRMFDPQNLLNRGRLYRHL
jgi:FAD/FMN-containing dehydrogenase